MRMRRQAASRVAQSLYRAPCAARDVCRVCILCISCAERRGSAVARHSCLYLYL